MGTFGFGGGCRTSSSSSSLIIWIYLGDIIERDDDNVSMFRCEWKSKKKYDNLGVWPTNQPTRYIDKEIKRKI